MEVFEQYSLINQKRWADLLRSLEPGEHTFVMPSVKNIHSFKSVAYRLNTDRDDERVYSIIADKERKLVSVSVKIN